MSREPRELHPDLGAEERQRLFREGIELFNQGLFFAAHEAWEEIWRSTTPDPRDLFQGLIQIAVGLHLFRESERPGPAARLLARGRTRLTPLSPTTHGLDVEHLLRQVQGWEAWLAEPVGERPPLPLVHILHVDEVR